MPAELHTIAVPGVEAIPLDEWQAFLVEVAATLENTIKDSWWESEGRGRWQRKWIVPGLVRDLNEGPRVRQRRFDADGGQTGVDTGNLRNTLTVQQDGDDLVLRAAEYGERFHKGGPGLVTFGPEFAANLRAWYRRSGNAAQIRSRGLGWLFGMRAGRTIRFTSPPRPMFDDDLIRQAARLVLSEWALDKIGGRSS